MPAERRQITVLFCDLVGSTALSEELDPEDLRDVIRRYHATCEGVVARYDGFVAQHLGDGVLVYFGHPRAHEDDAVRAVRAGLELRNTVAGLSVRGRPLAVRVGIHTGVVVVGAVGAEARQLALGATPNLASRVQQEALPGTVLISEATHRLVAGFFQENDLGARSVRGVTQPVHLYRVEGETGARSRMEATAAAGLTPFVGREAELALVLRLWADALDGKAPVLTLSGEPGIGKSRLVRALRERIGPEALVVECYASPLFQGTALHPIVEMLERQVGAASESPESRRARLRAQLEQTELATPATLGPLETLLSIAPPEEAQTANLSPQKQRQATFDALASWVRTVAERQPVLFVLEDLHWVDPSTIEFVKLLIERGSTGKLMIVLTQRPEFLEQDTEVPAEDSTLAREDPNPPHAFSSPRLTELTLQRMPPGEARQILAAVITDKQLPEAVEREVLAKADGVPLFVEEIAKAVLESRDSGPQTERFGPVSSREGFAIPATVVDSLTARLDRLGGGKKVIQIAATLGRTFALGVLLEVAGMQEGALRAELDRLQAAGLVHRREESSDESYIFKHALIQDAAYASLLRPTRQEYHRQIARALERRFPTIAASQPELLARHFDGAGMTPEAIAHWALAGQRAIARSANEEAISAFAHALRLLATLPASEKRDRQEIELRCGLGFAQISSKGWAAPEVEATYGPALELCNRYGDLPGRVLYGLWANFLARADSERAAQLIPRFERMIESSKNSQDLVTSHGLLSGYGFWTADYPTARRHADLGITYIDRRDPRRQAIELLSQGYEGQIYPLLFKAWTDIAQGRAKGAVAASEDAIDIASASGHPFLVAVSLSYGAAVAHDKHDINLLEARGRRLSELASDNGFQFFAITAMSYLGWVAARKGERKAGIDMMQQASGFYPLMGVNLLAAYYLSYVAEGCLDAERVDDGLAAINRALPLAQSKLCTFCVPELHRIKGDLLVLKGDVNEGEQCLRTAHSLAARRTATLFELRAALSLARLWSAQGRGAEATPMIRGLLPAVSEDEPIPERQQLAELGQRLGAV